MIEDKFLPEGFRALMEDQIGASAASTLLQALNGEPEVSIRINRHKGTEIQPYADTSDVAWCESGYYLASRPRFTFNPLLHAGAFYVQDASSMVYETIVRKLNGDRPAIAADLCAAPGGKTTAILNSLPAGSVMLANEYVASRASVLKENLTKYGYPEVIVTNTDTARLSGMAGCFDIVAVDAPCSGEGMMRKEETARTQWSEGLVRQCAALQREILQHAAEMVAPGGYLIYSTCTFNTTEDEDNALWASETLGLTPVDTGLAGTGGIRGQAKGDVPCLRFMPGFTRGEGLFVAVFRKEGDCISFGNHPSRKPRTKGDRKGKQKKPATDRAILEKASSWVKDDVEIINHDGRLLALTPATASLLSDLPKGVRIISAGVEIGEVKGKDLIPSHQLAMSTLMADVFPKVELTEEDAIRFLSRDMFALPPDTPKGFIAVTFKGLTLGLLKNLGNRFNNLYPQEYRIRTHN